MSNTMEATTQATSTEVAADSAMKPRMLQVRTEIKKQNDVLARELRDRWIAQGVCVISMVSSPGAGKTEFLKQTMARLVSPNDGTEPARVAAVVGDLATENDAARLAEAGAPVRQIVTGTICHLEADMVESSLIDAGWDLADLDFLFIENVGNMVCPATFDLGEHQRVVLVSTTEGEDKPLKYPTIFNTADIAVITKLDLAEALEFDRDAMLDAIQEVRPGMPTFEVSAKRGQGMDEWLDYLQGCLQAVRGR